MSIEQEIEKLTQSTSKLVEAVNTKKVILDTAVETAEIFKNAATAEKLSAQTARNEAEDFKNQASTFTATAGIQADRAKSEADNASAVVSGGTATLNSTAGSIPLADSDGVIDASWLPAEITGRNVFAEDQAKGNSKYAASGFVHMGRAKDDSNNYNAINDGLWTQLQTSNILNIGRGESATSEVGDSKSLTPILNIAGIETEITSLQLAAAGNWQAGQIRFPDAPNGTVTYDSATGVITDYTKDVDPKYGDVAADTNEAVARAFEGSIYGADFRLGDGAWYSSSAGFTIANGGLTVDNSAPYSFRFKGNYGRPLDCTKDITLKIMIKSVASGSTGGNGTAYGWRLDIYDDADINIGKGGIIPDYSVGNPQHGAVAGEYQIFKLPANTFTSDLAGLKFYAHTNYGQGVEVGEVILELDTVEVVTERVDMFGFEGFLEEVTATNPYVYPNGLIQSQASTMDGVTTGASNRPVTYYAVFDGDETSRGKGVNFLTASNDNKRKIFSNPKNNMYWIEGKLYQWRVRQRTIAGAGNGDWESTNSIEGDNIQYATKRRLMAQGAMNAPFGNVSLATTNVYYRGSAYTTSYYGVVDMPIGAFRAITNNNTSSPDDPSVSAIGGGYFLVCGTVPRLNKGVYHPSFNPMGTSVPYRPDGLAATNAWYYATDPTKPIDSLANAFLHKYARGSIVSNISGRPDGKFYDAIYASGQGGVIDYRLSAWDKSSPAEAAKVDAMVKNGSYRGVEYLTRTVIFDVTTSGGNVNGNSVYFSKTDYEVFNQFFTANVTVGTGTTAGWTQAHKAKTIGYLQRVDTGDIAPLIGYGYGSYGGSVNHFALAAGYYKTDWQDKECRAILFISREFSTSNSYVTSKLSVSGEFTQTDVIGDPANILANPDLKDGWMGSWNPIIPDGVINDFPISRKSLVSGTGTVITRTSNEGATWANSTNYYGSNWRTTTNNVTFTIPLGNVEIWDYTAFAKQTKVANKAPVLNGVKGIGNVFAQNVYGTHAGSLLTESFIGKVPTYTAGNASDFVVLTTDFYWATGELGNWGGYTLHQDISIVPYPSPAMKCLDYPTVYSQQVALNYSYEELVLDGDYGDDSIMKHNDGQTTNTDDNGNTVLCGTATLAIPYGWVKNEV